MKNKKPLTPKQRERLAREARKQNAARPAAAVAVKKPAMPKNTKRFIVLLAALLLFATLASVLFGFCFAKWRVDPTASVYDNIDMNEYLMLSEMGGKAFYTGKTIDLSAIYRKPASDEEFDAYLADLLLRNRKEIALGQKNTPIGKGDDVSYYVIGVKDKDGKAVLTNDFAAASYSSGTLTVGSGSFGEDFDEKIVGVVPADTYLQTVTAGKLTGDEVVIITLSGYTGKAKTGTTETDIAKKYTWNTTAEKTISSARRALSALDETLRAALVDNITIGESTTLYLENYDLTGDGTKEAAVRLDVTVHAIAIEKTVDVTFTLPEGYFSATDAEDLRKLNGTEVTFSLIIPFTNDYEMPKLDKAFITETMKYTPTATAEAAIVAEFKAAKRKELDDSLNERLVKAYVSQIFLQLASQTVTGANGAQTNIFIEAEYPTEAINDQYNALIEEYRTAYGNSPSSNEELTAYVQGAYGASSVDEVIVSNIKQTIFMYYIFRDAGLKITDEMVEKAYAEHLADLVEEAGDPEMYGEEHFIFLYTKEALYKQARKNLVYDLVGDYLIKNNTLMANGGVITVKTGE